MIGWLRRALGVVPNAYECPMEACRSKDQVVKAIITRAIPGQPWKNQPVGTLVMCAKCGCHYLITVDGKDRPLYAGGGMSNGPPPSERSREAEMRTFFDNMTDDLRRPSNPGV